MNEKKPFLDFFQGTSVLEVRARDGDLGEPRDLLMSIEGDDSGYFILQNVNVDDHGNLVAILATSQVPLDREDPLIINNGGIYTFNIRVSWIKLLYKINFKI